MTDTPNAPSAASQCQQGNSGNCPKPPLPKPPTKLKPPGLIWAVAGKESREVKMMFDTTEQANAFVAGLEADEPPNV